MTTLTDWLVFGSLVVIACASMIVALNDLLRRAEHDVAPSGETIEDIVRRWAPDEEW